MIRRFDKLSQQQLKELQINAIGKNVQIIVHPEFNGPNPKLDNYLNKKNTQTRITLIFESDENMKKIAERNPTALKKNSFIFWIHTPRRLDPNPAGGWQKIIARLLFIKGKNARVSVGGMNFGEITLAEIKNVFNAIELLEKGTKRGKEAKSTLRTIRRKIQERKKNKANLFECAGFTAARLGATGKFKIRTTRRFHKY